MPWKRVCVCVCVYVCVCVCVCVIASLWGGGIALTLYEIKSCINFGTYVTCRLHLYIYMHVVCMFHVTYMDLVCFHACYMKNYMYATCIWHFIIKNCYLRVLKLWTIVIDTCTCEGGVTIYSDVKRFGIISICTFLTCIKHDMLLTRSMHVTCLLLTRYMCCVCYYYLNMHTPACILPLLQHVCCLNMHYTWL